jgi:hypothetical protein
MASGLGYPSNWNTDRHGLQPTPITIFPALLNIHEHHFSFSAAELFLFEQSKNRPIKGLAKNQLNEEEK